jgi:hypothetical protein
MLDLEEEVKWATEHLQTIETAEERSARHLTEFANFWQKTVVSYEIKPRSKYPPTIETQRIAHLCSKELIILSKAPIGSDASSVFYRWAREKKLGCPRPVLECEYWEGKKRRKPLYAPYYKRLFPGLCFDKYIRVAEEIALPARFPVICRSPIVHW